MDKGYLFCYDMKLFEFLKEKGFRYITKAKHHKTGDLFSLYEQTQELSEAIREWKCIGELVSVHE